MKKQTMFAAQNSGGYLFYVRDQKKSVREGLNRDTGGDPKIWKIRGVKIVKVVVTPITRRPHAKRKTK